MRCSNSMAMNNVERPKFLTLFFEETASLHKNYGLKGVIPFWLLAFIGISVFVAYQIPESFWSDSSKNIPSYVGILTLAGLLLALAWNAFAKIFENICAPKFSAYLQQNGMLATYMFHISYVQFAQLLAVISGGIGLVLLLCDGIPVLVHRYVFAAILATNAYAIKEAVGAVTILYDLVWYRAIFESSQNGSDNVARFPSGR